MGHGYPPAVDPQDILPSHSTYGLAVWTENDEVAMAVREAERKKNGQLKVRWYENDVEAIRQRAKRAGRPIDEYVIQACLGAKIVERPTIAQREPDLVLMSEVDRLYQLLNKLGGLQKSFFDDSVSASAARRNDGALGAAIRDLSDAAKAVKIYFDDLNEKTLDRDSGQNS